MNAEERLKQLIREAKPSDKEMERKVRARWNSLCMPIGSLGKLQDYTARLGGIQRKLLPSLDHPNLVIMAGDNGVVEEGVSQCGSEVTAQVIRNMTEHTTAACIMAKAAGVEMTLVDMGMKEKVPHPLVLQRSLGAGTANIKKGPAMSRETAAEGILAGIEVMEMLKKNGCDGVLTGEMGIGNTTTSTAMAACFLDMDPKVLTGRGAGISDEGLERKMAVIEEAVAVNHPDKEDALDVLSKVGGFDLAGLAGCFIGGALFDLPVFIDGFISLTAAWTAALLCPAAKDYMIVTHMSAEPAVKRMMEKFDPPMLDAGMRMGEGTGALAAFPVIRTGLRVYLELPAFEEAKVPVYEDYSAKK